MNSTDFIALGKGRKQLWSGGQSCGLRFHGHLGLCVLSCSGVYFHLRFSWNDILCWLWAVPPVLCRGWKKRSCCREYGSAYTIQRGLQWGNSCWVTVSNVELASRSLLQCLYQFSHSCWNHIVASSTARAVRQLLLFCCSGLLSLSWGLKRAWTASHSSGQWYCLIDDVIICAPSLGPLCCCFAS